MNNIITVDFSKRKVIDRQVILSTEDNLTAFLNELREFELCEDDIMEVKNAIHDPAVYYDADEDTRAIADAWLYG